MLGKTATPAAGTLWNPMRYNPMVEILATYKYKYAPVRETVTPAGVCEGRNKMS